MKRTMKTDIVTFTVKTGDLVRVEVNGKFIALHSLVQQGFIIPRDTNIEIRLVDDEDLE